MKFDALRRHSRFDVDFAVRVEMENGRAFYGKSSNVSQGGMTLRHSESLADGDLVQVAFSISFDHKRIHTPAIVRWVSDPIDGVYTIGLEFAEMDPQFADALEDAINAKLDRRAAQRFPVRTKFELETQQVGRRRIESFARNVSETGMRLVASEPLESGDRVKLRTGSRTGNEPVELRSVVRWCAEDDGLRRYTIGVEFEGLDEGSEEFVSGLISFSGKFHARLQSS